MNDSEPKNGGMKHANGGMNGTAMKTSGPVQQPDDLHDLFATTDEEDPLANLRNDPNYSALIRDLEYIAKQARALFEPAQEAPSDKVWDNIQSQLGTKTPDA